MDSGLAMFSPDARLLLLGRLAGPQQDRRQKASPRMTHAGGDEQRQPVAARQRA